jgi:hypothetical protein
MAINPQSSVLAMADSEQLSGKTDWLVGGGKVAY